MRRLTAYVFMGILVSGSLMNLFFHTDNALSVDENRALQTRPVFTIEGYFSGDLTEALDRYMTDQFAFRPFWIRLSNHLEMLKGLPAERIEVVSLENENTAEKSEGEPEIVAEDPIRKSELIITEERAFSNHIRHPDGERHYAEALNQFAKAHPELEIMLMLPPTKAAFYTPPEFSDLTDDQRQSIDNIVGQLDSTIRFIDVYDALKAHSDEYVYLRTDHHWTALGAYYAYEVYARTLDLPVFDLANSDEVIVESFLGTLYKMSQSQTIAGYPDTLIGYAPKIPVEMVTDNDRVDHEVVGFFGYGTANYGMFLNGDAALKVIRSESPVAHGKLLVIKDSYANAFIPYLVQDYEEIHVIDPRHFEGTVDDYLTETGITSVLFFDNAAIGKYDSYHEVLYGVFKEVE